jgi:hypothetical protein
MWSTVIVVVTYGITGKIHQHLSRTATIGSWKLSNLLHLIFAAKFNQDDNSKGLSPPFEL